MAFNLKKVVRALLFSSSQPLAIKDIQDAVARFHEQKSAMAALLQEAATPGPAGASAAAAAAAPGPETAAANPALPADEPAEVADEAPPDPELYEDVPTMVTSAQLREVLDQIALELRAADEGLLLIEGASGYRLVTHPRFARWVRILRAEPPPVKLSGSSLETLAVIAYRQPVTRGEIEAIRGVSAEAGITRLLERDLIQVTGRADLPGRPLQYGTTDRFLEFTGLKSLDELPASDVLSSRQLDDWLQKAMNPTHLGDAEMGLPAEEQLPLETAGVAAAPPPAAAGDAAAQS
jgi:segregation and condensation protein B